MQKGRAMVLTVTLCCPVISDLNMSITARSISRVTNTGCTARSRYGALTLMKKAQSALPACNPHIGNQSRVISLKPPFCSLYSPFPANTLLQHGHGHAAGAKLPTARQLNRYDQISLCYVSM